MARIPCSSCSFQCAAQHSAAGAGEEEAVAEGAEGSQVRLVVGAGSETRRHPGCRPGRWTRVPSAFVSTTVTKAFGLTATLPLVPAAISRFVLPPTHKKTVLLDRNRIGLREIFDAPNTAVVAGHNAGVLADGHIQAAGRTSRPHSRLRGSRTAFARHTHYCSWACLLHHSVITRQAIGGVGGVPQCGVIKARPGEGAPCV